MSEVLDQVTITAVGPHGVLSNGQWYRVKDALKASFVKGQTYSVKTVVGIKGGKEITSIESAPVLNPMLNQAPPATPSYTKPKWTPRPQASSAKDDYWKRKEEKDAVREPLIQRSGIVQAALKAVSAHVAKTSDLAPEAIKVAEEVLKWINQ